MMFLDFEFIIGSIHAIIVGVFMHFFLNLDAGILVKASLSNRRELKI